MSTSKLKSLPKDTVRLIGSSQVITSVFSVVKELLENAFDAHATAVEVKLENYGFDKIEVRDNGTGIRKADIPQVALRYHTSKISSFSDLESLSTFGFRGEALGSLCAVSALSITSKTASEDVSHTFSFDYHGKVTSEKPSHLGQGTTIVASNLFGNMPVRRQYYKTLKKKKDELKKIEDLCLAYGAIKPSVRLTLRHNKDLVWQKNAVPDTKTALLSIYGRNLFSQLELGSCSNDEIKLTVEGYLPKAGSEVSVTSRSTGDRGFIAVNGRPVQVKDIDKCVRQHYCSKLDCEGRHPVYFLSVSMPMAAVDVNIDPNKTTILMQQQKLVLEAITNMCQNLYGPIIKLNSKDAEPVDSSTLSSPNTSVTNNSLDSLDKTSVSEEIRTDLDSGAVTELTHKFGHVIAENNNMVKGSLKHVETDNGLTISIHRVQSGTSVGLENEQLISEEQNPVVVVVDKDSLEDSLGQTKAASDMIIDKEVDIGGENEKVDFDILDKDMKEILTTQASESNIGENFDIEKYFNDSTEIFCDTLESGPEKENMDMHNSKKASDKLPQDKNENEADVNVVEKERGLFGKNQMAVHRKVGVEKLQESNKSHDGNDFDTDWSKGRVPGHGDCVLQPVQMLIPGMAGTAGSNKRPPSPGGDVEMIGLTPPAKKKAPNLQMDQPRIYEMVNSPDGDKFSTGFVAFSKQVRPKVVEKNPEASYDRITAMVRERWARLTQEEKAEFEQTGAQQLQQLRKLVTGKPSLETKIDRRLAPVKGLPSITDQLLAGGARSQTKKSVPMKSARLTFSLEKLRQICRMGMCQTQTQTDAILRPIGPLKYYNGWVCQQGCELKLINAHRVEETLLHREMMQDHQIPASRLEQPVLITVSCVGGPRHYQALMDMIPSDNYQTYVYIDDRRLTANGIQIRCHQNGDSQWVLELVGLCTAIPQYGVADLKEVLDLIVTTGASTVHQARPLKVLYYLQGEAVRMIRQRPVQRTREDICDLIQQMMTSLPKDCDQCLHNKPFLHTIYNLENIPLTQSQS